MREPLKQIKEAIVSIVTTFLMMASPVAAIVFASDSITTGSMPIANELASISYKDVLAALTVPAAKDDMSAEKYATDFKHDITVAWQEMR